MAKLLFLAHRVPYPPNKGERIRAFHPLKHLAETHEVWLGALADNEAELKETGELRTLCKEVHYTLRRPHEKSLAMALGAASGRALSISAFDNQELRSWCTRTIAAVRPDLVYIVSSAMAQYVLGSEGTARIVMDFVDADSAKFRQYAAARRGPMRFVYNLEAKRVLRFDRAVAHAAKACLFVSETDRNLFAADCPEAADKLHVVPNGVDCDYFDPAPFAAETSQEPIILFTGTMDYYPNVDAVVWFAHEIFPLVRAEILDARFQIVGTSPAPAVRNLAALPGIEVTGAVPDVRPFYARAKVSVAPLRIARGIQNKVLEAMAMARPTVATPNALDGIFATDGEHLLVARDARAFVQATLTALRGSIPDLGRKARENVIGHHAWRAQLAKLDAIIERVLSAP
ncbi:MAG: TIGR03087 family PEP-CTERM/XrtA system glycosyltransferase [Alphaproteobacteria bacterium]